MKTKMLKGLSYNLAQSFFSTLCYYEKGYMSDWIVNSANDLGTDRIEIDILKNRITPKELNIRPLLIYLDDLRTIIDKTLESNKLPKGFIVEAKFNISINEKREVVCDNYTTGDDNRIYRTKDFIEQSYEIFDTNLSI